MSKNPLKLAACVAVIHAADAHVRAYPSKATATEEVPAEMRAACHFLTRVTNQLSSGLGEYSSQQAASAVLGAPASYSTTGFTYVFPHPAIKHLRSLKSSPSTTVPPAPDSDSASATDDSDSDTDSQASNSSRQSQPSQPSDEDAPIDDGIAPSVSYGGGTASSFVVNGEVVSVPQHIHYGYRSVPFSRYSLYEYGGLVQVVKKKPSSSSAPEEAPTPADLEAGHTPALGRKPSATFDFDPQHPLFSTHTQQLRSKHLTPVLAGAPCPRYPGPQPDSPSKTWCQQAAAFSEYMLALFRPWDLSSSEPVRGTSWDDFCAFITELELGDGVSAASFVGRSIAAIIHNVARSLHTSHKRKKLSSRYRARCADLLLTRSRVAGGFVAVGDGLERRAADEISRLVTMADSSSQRASQRAEMSTYVQSSLDSALAVLGDVPVGTQEQPPGHGLHDARKDAVVGMVTSIYQRDPHGADVEAAEDVYTAPPIGGAGAAGSEGVDTDSSTAAGANAKQLEGVAIVMRYLRDLQTHRADGTAPAPEQLFLFVTGGPGVGKSFFARILDDAITQSGSAMACAAYTGCAACQVPRPQTLHSLLNLGGRKSKRGAAEDKADGNAPLKPLDQLAKQALQQRLRDVDVLLIDEVKLCNCRVLVHLHLIMHCPRLRTCGCVKAAISDMQLTSIALV